MAATDIPTSACLIETINTHLISRGYIHPVWSHDIEQKDEGYRPRRVVVQAGPKKARYNWVYNTPEKNGVYAIYKSFEEALLPGVKFLYNQIIPEMDLEWQTEIFDTTNLRRQRTE